VKTILAIYSNHRLLIFPIEVYWEIVGKEFEMTEKYTPLKHYLMKTPLSQQELTLSFEHIERIIKDELPLSAFKHRPWWANEKYGTHSHAWMDAGWKADTVDFSNKWVRFLRTKKIIE